MNKKGIFSLAMASSILLSSCNAGFSANADTPPKFAAKKGAKVAKQATSSASKPTASEPEASAPSPPSPPSDELAEQGPEPPKDEAQEHPVGLEGGQQTKKDEPSAPAELPELGAEACRSGKAPLIPNPQLCEILCSGGKLPEDAENQKKLLTELAPYLEAIRWQGTELEGFLEHSSSSSRGIRIYMYYSEWLSHKDTVQSNHPFWQGLFSEQASTTPDELLATMLRFAATMINRYNQAMLSVIDGVLEMRDHFPKRNADEKQNNDKIIMSCILIQEAILRQHDLICYDDSMALHQIAEVVKAVADGNPGGPKCEDAKNWMEHHALIEVGLLAILISKLTARPTRGTEFAHIAPALPCHVMLMANQMKLLEYTDPDYQGLKTLITQKGEISFINGERVWVMEGESSPGIKSCLLIYYCCSIMCLEQITTDSVGVFDKMYEDQLILLKKNYIPLIQDRALEKTLTEGRIESGVTVPQEILDAIRWQGTELEGFKEVELPESFNFSVPSPFDGEINVKAPVDYPERVIYRNPFPPGTLPIKMYCTLLKFVATIRNRFNSGTIQIMQDRLSPGISEEQKSTDLLIKLDELSLLSPKYAEYAKEILHMSAKTELGIDRFQMACALILKAMELDEHRIRSDDTAAIKEISRFMQAIKRPEAHDQPITCADAICFINEHWLPEKESLKRALKRSGNKLAFLKLPPMVFFVSDHVSVWPTSSDDGVKALLEDVKDQGKSLTINGAAAKVKHYTNAQALEVLIRGSRAAERGQHFTNPDAAATLICWNDFLVCMLDAKEPPSSDDFYPFYLDEFNTYTKWKRLLLEGDIQPAETEEA